MAWSKAVLAVKKQYPNKIDLIAVTSNTQEKGYSASQDDDYQKCLMQCDKAMFVDSTKKNPQAEIKKMILMHCSVAETMDSLPKDNSLKKTWGCRIDKLDDNLDIDNIVPGNRGLHAIAKDLYHNVKYMPDTLTHEEIVNTLSKSAIVYSSKNNAYHAFKGVGPRKSVKITPKLQSALNKIKGYHPNTKQFQTNNKARFGINQHYITGKDEIKAKHSRINEKDRPDVTLTHINEKDFHAEPYHAPQPIDAIIADEYPHSKYLDKITHFDQLKSNQLENNDNLFESQSTHFEKVPDSKPAHYSISLTGYNTMSKYKDLVETNVSNINDPYFQKMQSRFEDFISSRIKQFPKGIECHSGMHPGLEQIWAKAIVNAKKKYPDKVKFVADVSQLHRSDEWTVATKHRYAELLKHADEVDLAYEPDAWTYNSGNKKLNQMMIGASNELIAVCNKAPRGILRGNIKYAKQNGCQITRLDPEKLSWSLANQYDVELNRNMKDKVKPKIKTTSASFLKALGKDFGEYTSKTKAKEAQEFED